MSKKADLSLSVNSIVVLILAITMLGLGLGFVSGMFGKVSKQVEEQIAKEPEPSSPTASNPITLSRERVIANSGDDVVLKVAVFNPSSQDWINIAPVLSCSKGKIGDFTTLSPLIANPIVQVKEKNIDKGAYEKFNLILKVPSTSAQEDLCQISVCVKKVNNDYTKDYGLEGVVQKKCTATANNFQYFKDLTIKIID